MLTDEAPDAAPVPERPPCEESRVRLAFPFVPHDGGGHVPALPARLRGAVGEIDVFAVEPEAGVEAAELLEHRAAQEHETPEEPIRPHRLVRLVAEVVVLALPLERRTQTAQRRAARERAAYRREPATRRHELAMNAGHARTGDSAPRMRLDE